MMAKWGRKGGGVSGWLGDLDLVEGDPEKVEVFWKLFVDQIRSTPVSPAGKRRGGREGRKRKDGREKKKEMERRKK